ncbi:MAG: radical SAM protein [Candidatus Omnitrophota bacterium]
MKKKVSLCDFLSYIPKFFPTFIDNFFVYRWPKAVKRGPLFVSWDLSHICNLRCIHCAVWKQKKEGLSFGQKINIIRQLGRAGVFYLGLGGGEPLLDEHLGDLIKEAKKWRMVVNVSTNGLLLEDKTPMLIDAGVDYVTISVDSHLSSVHDAIRGYPGLLEKVKKGISILKKDRQGKNPVIIIRTVVSNLNISHLDRHIQYWESAADKIIFKPVSGNCIYYSVPESMRLCEQDKTKLDLAVKSIMKRATFFERYYYQKFSDAFFNPARLKQEFCCAGVSLANIDCQGNLHCCGEQRFLLGNLRQTDFMTIWKNDRAREWRCSLKNGKRLCYCWSDCFMVNILLSHLFGRNIGCH